MLKRDSDSARLAVIFRMAEILGVSVEELVFEDAPAPLLSPDQMRVLSLYAALDQRGKDTVVSLLEKEAELTKTPAAFPVYEAPAAAGAPLPVLTEEKIPGADSGEADFGIRISGDSMEPLIADGQTVRVRRADEIGSGEVGIFLLNGESLCKKYVRQNGETRLESINPRYAPIPVLETDELKLVGTVVL
jgi:SOS-response transcriptional repressor LexA